MNPLLQNKINELESSQDFECWYLVKHNPDFCNLCYLVDALQEFQTNKNSRNVEEAVNKKISEVNTAKNLSLSNNYRALRVAAFLGLIRITSSSYNDAIITDVYKEIKELCHGNYEDIYLYKNVINRQIEKLYTASIIDEGYNQVRKNYRIYPVMFLYKVLVELGKTTHDYSVSMVEYKYLISTTKKYSDYLDTMLLIKLLRDDPSVELQFTRFRSKFDNRMNVAIELLEYLDFSGDRIKIKDEYVAEINKKVYEFENGNFDFGNGDSYVDFLCSKKGFLNFNIDNNAEHNEEKKDIDYDTCSREIGGENVILYGVPGAGKSWTIKNEYCGDDSKIERLVFHPDYTYSDFVGQILPKLDENNQVTYVFTPGPFTNILKKAYLHPDCKYYLVIEEVNRGNAPAIFGDIFQLLDRKVIDGSSEYSITNSDIAREVYGNDDHKVSIPSNLSILGTMNTSDQNVFTLDTAFQRRWSMRLIQNKFPEDGSEKDFANTKILDTDVTWEKFFTEINNLILSKNIRMTSSEDKRLGTHFISKEELVLDTTVDDKGNLSKSAVRHNKKFAEKVLKYLWDDAFKFNKDEVFDLTKVNSLEKVIVEFTSVNGNERFGKILKQNIYDALIPKKTN